MLNSHSHKVLKAVQKLYKAKNNTFVGSSADVLAFCPNTYTEASVNQALWYLQEQEYVECEEGDNTICEVDITYSGIHYGEFERVKFLNFIITSIFVPIFVSLVTTIITLVVSNALQ